MSNREMSHPRISEAQQAAERRQRVTAAPIDDPFERRLNRALNDAGMLLMLSIGHRTGLLTTLDGAPPLTSTELARWTGLEERYVREWLNAMVTARVVALDANEGTYRLPPEHAARLTDQSQLNLAVLAQFLPMLGQVENDILHCFREGGGVPHGRYPRFQHIMAEQSGQTVLRALFDRILPLSPDLPARLEAGIRVLDVGCGRGRVPIVMAQRFPNSRFTGIDLSEDAIAWAQHQAYVTGLDNIEFKVRDLSDFDRTAERGCFELVTGFDAVADQARPNAVLRGIRHSLSDDGVSLIQEIRAASAPEQNVDHPLGAFLYALSVMHCLPVSLASDGEGLGAMWGREKVMEYLERAGFGTIERHTLRDDMQNEYFICRP